MSCLVSCTSGLFQYTISHVTESACVTPLGSDRLCLLVFYLVFGHEKGDKRHEAPGGRQDPSDMRHKARDRISARAKSATTATLQVALALAVGVSQPCRKVLLRGSPPESREMGPELGPRLQGPLKEGPVCGPRIRAALLGKKSPDNWRKSALQMEKKCSPRTTFGSPPKGVPSAVRKGHSTTRCASSWTPAARSVVDAKVTASPAAGSRRETKCRVVSKAQLYTASWGFDPSALLRQSRILLELPALPFRRSYDALGGSWGKTEFRTSRV